VSPFWDVPFKAHRRPAKALAQFQRIITLGLQIAGIGGKTTCSCGLAGALRLSALDVCEVMPLVTLRLTVARVIVAGRCRRAIAAGCCRVVGAGAGSRDGCCRRAIAAGCCRVVRRITHHNIRPAAQPPKGAGGGAAAAARGHYVMF
jgi:hypothetical protein